MGAFMEPVFLKAKWFMLENGDLVASHDYSHDMGRYTDKGEGWCGRLSAPGCMDCTDWLGPYATEIEAAQELEATYEVCSHCGMEIEESDATECPHCEETYAGDVQQGEEEE